MVMSNFACISLEKANNYLHCNYDSMIAVIHHPYSPRGIQHDEDSKRGDNFWTVGTAQIDGLGGSYMLVDMFAYR